jgi:peptidoglycan hydrolase-like protein with peptidoglycan-binding domain
MVLGASVGCSKKEPLPQQAELNADGLSVSQADALLAKSSSEAVVVEKPVANIVVDNNAGPLVETVEVAAAIPAAPALPDDMTIQKALKNAGFYQGEIDGKIGPRSQEAIKEFQRKNNLVDDGKVGAKTWSLLKVYLEQPAAPVVTQTNS